LKRGVNIIWITTIVSVEAHFAVPLKGTVDWDFRGVGGELLVIDAETVTGCVRVGEEACLED
jgi:hypothetical protein